MAESEKDCREYKELLRLKEELQAEIDAVADRIKAAMGDTVQAVAGPYKVTYRDVTSSRMDTTALKTDMPDLAARYTKTSTYKRLSIS